MTGSRLGHLGVAQGLFDLGNRGATACVLQIGDLVIRPTGDPMT
ncbi:hypothetical protein OG259_40305 [Streptomyces sp. NBC_00250]|nr:hypothetical protein [Streptomyces sp. NBC_00250]